MACLGTGGKRETTEWEDILKSKGIIPEKTEEELVEEALHEVVEETVERYDPHENKDLDELEEDLEDADSDEEAILEQYRQKRIMEMKAAAARPRFGPGVTFLSATDWKREVTEAGADIYVVVHLFQPGVDYCKLMDARLLALSQKFRHTKFVKCKATDAIKNYPDDRLPTILVYKNGKVLKQFVGLAAFAGSKTSEADVEWALSRTGAVETEMVEPPGEDTRRFRINRV